MGRPLISFYTPEVVACKQSYYNSLPEKAKRHFLGQEYIQLGKGSQRYLAKIFNCARDTIIRERKELESPDFCSDYYG